MRPAAKPEARGRGCGQALVTSLLAVWVLAGLLATSAAALAGTTPLQSSSALPWADPGHRSPFELLASRIASHIAGRTVSVDCEGPSDWVSVVRASGGDPSAEAGFVSTTWSIETGALVSASSVAELDGETVCLPLQSFAAEAARPTSCPGGAAARATTAVGRRSPGRALARRATAARAAGRHALEPGPCRPGGGKAAALVAPAYGTGYALLAGAILTLAHESVHLGGVVGGRLENGLPVGDQQAEAKADCYGMQWMPYVAEQLGDSATDAQAIADFYWATIYPQARTSASPGYWSAECTPGGALDLHLAASPSWP